MADLLQGPSGYVRVEDRIFQSPPRPSVTTWVHPYVPLYVHLARGGNAGELSS